MNFYSIQSSLSLMGGWMQTKQTKSPDRKSSCMLITWVRELGQQWITTWPQAKTRIKVEVQAWLFSCLPWDGSAVCCSKAAWHQPEPDSAEDWVIRNSVSYVVYFTLKATHFLSWIEVVSSWWKRPIKCLTVKLSIIPSRCSKPV